MDVPPFDHSKRDRPQAEVDQHARDVVDSEEMDENVKGRDFEVLKGMWMRDGLS